MRFGAVVVAAFAFVAAAVGAAWGGDIDRTGPVGRWYVYDNPNRLPDGERYFAVNVMDRETALILQCVRHELALLITIPVYDPGPFVVGDTYKIRIFADLDDPIEMTAVAISSKDILLPRDSGALDAVRGARRVVLHLIRKPLAIERIFDVWKANDAAHVIEQDCPRGEGSKDTATRDAGKADGNRSVDSVRQR